MTINKYKLIDGEVARISSGNACPIYRVRGAEICYADDVQEIEKKVRAMIWQIAKEEGGQILHYNEKIDEIFGQELGSLKEEKTMRPTISKERRSKILDYLIEENYNCPSDELKAIIRLIELGGL